jgi:hypothetical protein
MMDFQCTVAVQLLPKPTPEFEPSTHVRRALPSSRRLGLCRAILLGFVVALAILLVVPAPAHAQGNGAWIWQNPLPQGNSLIGTWGSDGTHVWAVGDLIGSDDGVILYWDGATWIVQNTTTYPTLNGIWGLDATHVWVVGMEGIVLQWNGATWTQESTAANVNFRSIWGTHPSNIWVAGSRDRMATILKWNGSTWSQEDTGVEGDTHEYFYGLWGTPVGQIWTVAGVGAILYSDKSAHQYLPAISRASAR